MDRFGLNGAGESPATESVLSHISDHEIGRLATQLSQLIGRIPVDGAYLSSDQTKFLSPREFVHAHQALLSPGGLDQAAAASAEGGSARVAMTPSGPSNASESAGVFGDDELAEAIAMSLNASDGQERVLVAANQLKEDAELARLLAAGSESVDDEDGFGDEPAAAAGYGESTAAASAGSSLDASWARWHRIAAATGVSPDEMLLRNLDSHLEQEGFLTATIGSNNQALIETALRKGIPDRYIKYLMFKSITLGCIKEKEEGGTKPIKALVTKMSDRFKEELGLVVITAEVNADLYTQPREVVRLGNGPVIYIGSEVAAANFTNDMDPSDSSSPNPVFNVPGRFLPEHASHLNSEALNDLAFWHDEVLPMTLAKPIIDERGGICPSQDSYQEMADTINYLVEQNPDKKILVHCRMGTSRSATAIIAYLIKYQESSLDDALALLRGVDGQPKTTGIGGGLAEFERAVNAQREVGAAASASPDDAARPADGGGLFCELADGYGGPADGGRRRRVLTATPTAAAAAAAARPAMAAHLAESAK
tara:strand:- start:1632 stop:3248 length:1617 start_codon:yes stop_codon:yes gene_type:complete